MKLKITAAVRFQNIYRQECKQLIKHPKTWLSATPYRQNIAPRISRAMVKSRKNSLVVA